MRALSVVIALVSAAFSGWLWLLFSIADSGALCDGGVDCRSGNEGIESLLAFLLLVSFLVVAVGLLGRWQYVVFVAAMSAVALELAVLAQEGWDVSGNGTFSMFLAVTIVTPWIAAVAAIFMRPRAEGASSSPAS